jgi:hypothetical protein
VCVEEALVSDVARLRFNSFSYENRRIIFQNKGILSYISFTRAENKIYSIYFISKTCSSQTFSLSYWGHSFDNEVKSRPTSGAFMYLHRRVLVFCMPLTCCSCFPDELIIFWFISTHIFDPENTFLPCILTPGLCFEAIHAFY